jgi:hypothetical protein
MKERCHRGRSYPNWFDRVVLRLDGEILLPHHIKSIVWTSSRHLMFQALNCVPSVPDDLERLGVVRFN